MLGLDKVIWLHKGMAGDDAVRFFSPLWRACACAPQETAECRPAARLLLFIDE